MILITDLVVNYNPSFKEKVVIIYWSCFKNENRL